MANTIVQNLQPVLVPVALVWSNTIPDDALQFKEGKFGYAHERIAPSRQVSFLAAPSARSRVWIRGNPFPQRDAGSL